MNNAEQAALVRLRNSVGETVKYLIFQHEVGQSGTVHVQGYLQLVSKKRLGGVRALLPGAHFEVRKGTHEEAVHYCQKPVANCECEHCAAALLLPVVREADEPVVLGVPTTGAGARSDLDALKASLDSGMQLVDVADQHFAQFLRYSRTIKEYQVLRRQNERNWHTVCDVYWGPSGTGKSRRAQYEAGPGAYWLPKAQGSQVWFDGYDGQEVVVIDEFYGWIPRDLMQRLCDRYALLVPVKGGTVPFVARRIIVTSNQSPDKWWPRIGLGAMTRRFEGEYGSITHMSVGVWAPPGDEQPVAADFGDEELVEVAAAAEAAVDPFGSVDFNAGNAVAHRPLYNAVRSAMQRRGEASPARQISSAGGTQCATCGLGSRACVCFVVVD